jgi:hypothetical protein
MAFDEAKVQFTAEEMAAAKAADALYDLFAQAVADGIDMSDFAVMLQAVPHIKALYGFLAEGSKADYAKKSLALGVALIRDNEVLDMLEPDPVE